MSFCCGGRFWWHLKSSQHENFQCKIYGLCSFKRTKKKQRTKKNHIFGHQCLIPHVEYCFLYFSHFFSLFSVFIIEQYKTKSEKKIMLIHTRNFFAIQLENVFNVVFQVEGSSKSCRGVGVHHKSQQLND